MKKRILSLIMIISILCTFVAYADDAQSENKYYTMATTLLETVCEDEVLPVGEADIIITRAEFVAALEKTLNINIAPCTEVDYSDVPVTHKYAYEIHTALKMGWISEAASFRPADGITYSEAAKIVCSALGYDVIANSRGGYPAGYLNCASDIRLDNGISNYSSVLTKADVAVILYNTLNSKKFKQTGFGDVLEFTESDVTVAEEVYDLYRFDGVVTATPFNSLVSSYEKTSDNTIKVNGILYRYTGVTPDMLGKNFEFYICENPDNAYNEIVWCYERYGVSKEVNLYNAYMKSSDKVQTDDGVIKLASPYNFIYNGTKITDKIDDYMGKASCDAVFVDADDDGEFETVSVSEYSYIIVESIDVDGKSICGADGVALELSAKDCNTFVEGVWTEDFSLVKKELYAYTISKDKKLVQLYECNNSADLVMTGKNTDTLVLGEEEYVMSDYFKTNYLKKADFDVQITYYFGLNNELVYLEKHTDDYLYGYLIKANVSKGLDPRTEIKIYTEEDEFVSLPLADRAIIDGVKLTKKAAAFLESEDSAFIKKPQLVRVYIKDGQITKLDTAQLSTADDPVDYDRDDNDNKLTQYVFDKYIYRSTSTSFAPYFSVELTTVFFIPDDLEDEDAFQIGDNSAFSNSDTYTNIEVYDIDVTGNAPIIVMDVADKTGIGRHNLVSYVVEKVSRVLNADGEEVNMLYLWRNGSVVKLESPDSVSLKKPSGKGITKGDIVSIYSYDGVSVSYLQADFDVESVALNGQVDIVHNSDTLSSKLSYNTGFVYSAGSTYLVLDKSTDVKSTADFKQINLRTMSLNYNAQRNIYVYDSEEKTVTAISASAIKKYLEYGVTGADFAVVRHNLGLANIIYIYR